MVWLPSAVDIVSFPFRAARRAYSVHGVHAAHAQLSDALGGPAALLTYLCAASTSPHRSGSPYGAGRPSASAARSTF